MLEFDPPDLVKPRATRLDASAQKLGVDAWILTRSRSVRFATGAHTNEIDSAGELCSPIVACAGNVFESPRSIADPHFFDDLVDGLPRRGTVAIDRLGLTALDRLQSLLPDVDIVDAAALLHGARNPLEPSEVAIMTRGLRLTEEAFLRTLADAEGKTERRLAGVFHREANHLGLELQTETVFSVLPRFSDNAPWLQSEWAAGPPYRGRTTDIVPSRDDYLTFDGGGDLLGYASDLGWVFQPSNETPSAPQQELSERWREVALRVIEAARPGASSGDLARAALQGWPKDAPPPWPQSLYVAHGIGTDVAQSPFAGADDGSAVIQEGHVLMVEPWVWAEGTGGYRAEYCVHVGRDQTQILNRLDVGYWPSERRTFG